MKNVLQKINKFVCKKFIDKYEKIVSTPTINISRYKFRESIVGNAVATCRGLT